MKALKIDLVKTKGSRTGAQSIDIILSMATMKSTPAII